MRIKVRGNNLPRIKTTNQFLIREAVYLKSPVSRIEIASDLGLTLPTVTTNISTLIEKGLMRELPEPVRTGSLGRRTMLVDVVPDARLFIGVEIRGTLRRSVVVNLRGKVLASGADDTFYTDYDLALESAVDITRKMISESGISLDRITAVGICIPGLVDSHEGVLGVHPGYQWEKKTVCKDFASKLGYSGDVRLENNAIARAYGISLFDHGKLKDASTFAYMFVAAGIACPLLSDVKNRFGTIAGEGEVGHMVMNPDGPECICGNHGCLETYASERIILQKAEECLKNGSAPVLKEIIEAGNPLDMTSVVESQKRGDPAIQKIISDAILYLGLAIANIDNFVKPECVVIECRLFDNPDNRESLMKIINNNLYRKTFNDYRFSFLQSDEYSGAKGAAAVAIKGDIEKNYVD